VQWRGGIHAVGSGAGVGGRRRQRDDVQTDHLPAAAGSLALEPAPGVGNVEAAAPVEAIRPEHLGAFSCF
jgi:hypothetical protein